VARRKKPLPWSPRLLTLPLRWLLPLLRPWLTLLLRLLAPLPTLHPAPPPLWLMPLRLLSMPLLPSKQSTESKKAASGRLFSCLEVCEISHAAQAAWGGSKWRIAA
jgi:hypothetical protein